MRQYVNLKTFQKLRYKNVQNVIFHIRDLNALAIASPMFDQHRTVSGMPRMA